MRECTDGNGSACRKDLRIRRWLKIICVGAFNFQFSSDLIESTPRKKKQLRTSPPRSGARPAAPSLRAPTQESRFYFLNFVQPWWFLPLEKMTGAENPPPPSNFRRLVLGGGGGGRPDYLQKLKVPEGYEKIRLYQSQILQVNTRWNSYLFEKKIEKRDMGRD